MFRVNIRIRRPGGIPIDGPSAGAAMFLALYSAYTETPVPNTLALTGEIGLHGQILPVGGVEDKLEAAQQAGATLALIPQENWRGVYREIEVVPVGDAETLLRRVFPPGEGATLSEGMEFLVGQEIGYHIEETAQMHDDLSQKEGCFCQRKVPSFGFWQTALYLQAGKTDPFPLRRQKIDKFSFLPLPRGRSA